MLSGSLLNNNKIITTPPVIRNICISQDPKNGPEQFYAMHQGQATSLIAKGINSTVQTDSFTGEGVVEDNGRKLVFEDYTELFGSIGSTAKQLYIALSIEIPGSRNNTIRLPLDKYMEMRRLKNKKEIRKQVKADLKTLASIRIEFKEKRRGEEVGYLNMRLFGGTEGIMNGVIVFKFNTDFLDLVRKYNVSPLPMGLLTINQNKNQCH